LFCFDFLCLFNRFLRLCVPLLFSCLVNLFILLPLTFCFPSSISFVFSAGFSLFHSSLFLPRWLWFICITFNSPKLITFQTMIYKPAIAPNTSKASGHTFGFDGIKHIQICDNSFSLLLPAYGCPDRCRSNASPDPD
jgi:hypothetical protein